MLFYPREYAEDSESFGFLEALKMTLQGCEVWVSPWKPYSHRQYRTLHLISKFRKFITRKEFIQCQPAQEVGQKKT